MIPYVTRVRLLKDVRGTYLDDALRFYLRKGEIFVYVKNANAYDGRIVVLVDDRKTVLYKNEFEIVQDEDPKFWVVWKEGGGTPTIKHGTKQNARYEAERLAKCNPKGRFFVLESTDVCSVKSVEWKQTV